MTGLGECPWGRASFSNCSPLGTSNFPPSSLACEDFLCSCLFSVMHFNTYMIYVYVHAYKNMFIYVDTYIAFALLCRGTIAQ